VKRDGCIRQYDSTQQLRNRLIIYIRERERERWWVKKCCGIIEHAKQKLIILKILHRKTNRAHSNTKSETETKLVEEYLASFKCLGKRQTTAPSISPNAMLLEPQQILVVVSTFTYKLPIVIHS
jgi:hypothetical protein